VDASSGQRVWEGEVRVEGGGEGGARAGGAGRAW